jgi:hypothetical protein
MKNTIPLVFFCACFFLAQDGVSQRSEEVQSEYTFKTIQVHNYAWGYNIYLNNKLMIHQPTIPGLPGNEGFKTKEVATKVAGLVIEKMKRGEMPPTVTKEELNKLNAL